MVLKTNYHIFIVSFLFIQTPFLQFLATGQMSTLII